MEAAWPDRHRPTDLEDMALAPELRQRFEYFLAHGLPRHLVLSGPPGFGKTTIASIIIKQLYRDHTAVMSVNSGDSGNVEYIRATVINFMRSMSMLGGSKLLIFEEATGLSPEAQVALREPLENWEDLCRVIFITNDPDKLDRAVRRRCDPIVMDRPPTDEIARVLGRVIEKEGVTLDLAMVQAFVRGYFVEHPDGDLASLLSAAQRYIETKGQLPVPPEPPPSSKLEMWQSQYRPEDATDGAKLLNDLTAEFAKYLSLPMGGVEAMALWTVFAWVHEAFSISPILTLVSPTLRAGKTTFFEMLEQLLIPGATYLSSNTKPVHIFRLGGLWTEDQNYASPAVKLPTLCFLLDEADDWINVGRDLRSIIDSAWTRKSARVPRMVPGDVKPTFFSTWYPKALALIDTARSPLPKTIRDRGILIPMQRKAKGEAVTKLRRDQPVPALAVLCKAVHDWVMGHYAALYTLASGPSLADDTLKSDRAQDNWHPLMCIARAAGGDWEKRARWASHILSDATGETELLEDLLADIKAVFDAEQVDELQSVVLVKKLLALEGSQWKERRLTYFTLSKMLRRVSNGAGGRIQPKQLHIDTGHGVKGNKNGYRREWFADAFTRYL